MNKPSSLIWMVFILLLILPTPVGRLFIDFAGGLFLVITLIPFILGGIALISWKIIKSKIKTCESCGSSFLNNQSICPVCGNSINNQKGSSENIPASSATIDIKSENID